MPKRLETFAGRIGRMFGIKEKKESTVHLKEKGVIPNNLCTLLCELVSLDSIPAQKCVDAFKRIASTLGIDVEGDILPRSINRVVKEGGMAAKIHMVEAFKDASGIALSSDGTSHKNNNYESH
ncbi:hypothetical protein K435DRAFT_880106 [Dendrothele bispora CBS 962.96]|uniref:Uncharacterized protein n=1 Tax=Dendrothele bispora (strain CBS 962.96) TaxID=1314807 RepID=A0A4S8KKW9_DENBC|nr:hypothetical protein K435DRAFT_880106 [Dendrothele bispora CBS 962.96]